MSERSSIFDMIGPIMIGPSSSHTAGVVRIGRTAFKILGKKPTKSIITFYNSFAQTYEGHGSDRAIIAGLMDFATDDTRIKTALDIAQETHFDYTFKAVGNASLYHPNTIKLELWEQEQYVEIIGESRGGGLINIASVNGFRADFTASSHTLMIEAEDARGMVAFIASILSHDNCNIATMNVSRKGKNDLACHFYETDSALRPLTIEYIKSIQSVQKVIQVDLTNI